MFQERGVFFFASVEASLPEDLSSELEPICDTNRINTAPKAQLASAITTLRLPDRPLFFDLSSIQTSTFVEGQERSNFYTAMNSVSSRKTAASRDDSCLAVGGFVSNWQIAYGQKNTRNEYRFSCPFGRSYGVVPFDVQFSTGTWYLPKSFFLVR